jgi:hypothetical protein
MTDRKTRSQINDQAVRDSCFQTTPPVGIRRNPASLSVAFLRRHVEALVSHHPDNGPTGLLTESAIEALTGWRRFSVNVINPLDNRGVFR